MGRAQTCEVDIIFNQPARLVPDFSIFSLIPRQFAIENGTQPELNRQTILPTRLRPPADDILADAVESLVTGDKF
jgi:hypothetical protein